MKVTVARSLRASRFQNRLLKHTLTIGRVNDNLQQQLRLLYDYWFTQFDFPDENGHPYRSAGGTLVWNGHLKKAIPVDWHPAYLRDILVPQGRSIDDSSSYSNLYYTPIDVIPKRTISFAGGLPASEANSSLQLYDQDDILLGAMRVYFHRVCVAAQSGITRSTTMVLKPTMGADYMGYAYSVLNNDSTILYATTHSSGTQQPYINWNGALENYCFAMPNNPQLLLDYSQFSNTLIREAQQREKENLELTHIRDWLLPMLMNGQAIIGD